MKLMKYEEFSQLPEGVVFTHYYPRQKGYMIKGRLLPHCEGLWVKGKTWNSDPNYGGDHTYQEKPLVPEENVGDVDEWRDSEDEIMQMVWRNSVDFDPCGHWGIINQHYWAVFEKQELSEILRHIDHAINVTPVFEEEN